MARSSPDFAPRYLAAWRHDNVLNPSFLTVTVGYKPEIDLVDERRSSGLSRRQFMSCFLGGTAVGAGNDNASEYSRYRNSHNRQIEMDRTDQDGDKHYGAGGDGDPSGQGEFAATFDSVGKLIDLHLEPHDLVAIVAGVHDDHVGGRCYFRFGAGRR
jgi:hypothetical protein